ncbi:MAG: Tfp pilus assembly protein FimT/FimU [Inhella sp.]|uniref:pilus assembly FimT family protein n=1 Tax=Inhella sp. TaxID=1921806 RepID=UPI00391C4341
MLNRPRAPKGFTLVEAMVVLAILGLMLAYAVPAFTTWLQNARIRATAESIQQGLMLARSEATSRNAQVRFQLTSDLTSACVRSTTASNWIVDLVDLGAGPDAVVGACDAPVTDTPTAPPNILHKRSATEGSAGIVVDVNPEEVVVNGMGRVVPLPADAITYDVFAGTVDQCRQVAGGTLTCLRVLVSPAGQVRMCNPAFPTGDPQAC